MKKSFYSVLVLVIAAALGVWSLAPHRAEGASETEAKKEEKAAEKKDEKVADSKDAKKADEKSSEKPAEKKEVARRTTSSCLVDELALEDLKERREELNQKKKEIDEREKELKAKEVALESEIKKLKDQKDELLALQNSQAAASDEKVNKVVEGFEAMQPKAISQVLNTMDELLAVNVLNKMSTAKVAKIMNIMDPAKSSRLYELMAGVVRARGLASTKQAVPSNDGAATANTKEGGEK